MVQPTDAHLGRMTFKTQDGFMEFQSTNTSWYLLVYQALRNLPVRESFAALREAPAHVDVRSTLALEAF